MDPIERVSEKVAAHMDKIAGYFKPGAKLTVMVRFPGFPDQDFMMTSDDLGELAAMIERRKAAE